MKGIILAGGNGSRLHPITKVINKHLLPVGKYPMIYYPLAALKKAGIQEVIVVSSKQALGDIIKLLGSGKHFNLDITYKVQEGAGGIAEALGVCEDVVNNDSCLVLLGDNIFESDLNNIVERFKIQGQGARVVLKEVQDPRRYGIAEIVGNKIVSIEEKPENPKSNYCVTGIYLYDNRVFEIIKGLKPSNRNELEITDVNNWYINESQLNYDILEGWWIDAGTANSLFKANQMAAEIQLERDLAK